ncbi:TIGR01457 family HAD-type hydrolase [Liquorilactobacillus satsumensis]|uniref:TIGR01457 family HAD-type hydrolase n=1 Tax=Liquorilactobacillus satsumensis TaxID=259059 RepID=UPI001E4AAFE8|nr:TIGR01457 family HAD-type hydrolase [Liquorilactobacillus satsumensis]MCC7667406.1 TIGR01457 family HAD-type hydrolase [Liquorilactobacillus satsumensis]MCP9313265.1 TIGR01457 family HAD-type hydrolase [Liquorilactobacillus satsumensis]MCP9329517.1 TIGR01457 family HAD-type hydrolase [Liquorilactobacillus satsumensis]MCP9358622.1 TIGR01457 family HAD-type hydrolase [Liquorilactobacillus satsumensis]MCP9360374.1 TIGR01457 family HAD-type hydrolase [Liquorilactobacillus satsumensis]
MKKYKGYLIDLDGTIYRGKMKIPAAKRFIEQLQARKREFLFVTNNSTKSPEDVVANLADNFDIHVLPSNVYTTAIATADYLAELDPKKRSVYAIGELGLKNALLERGFSFADETPDYVVVGLDYDVTYRKFEKATLAIKRGAKFIGTNADTNLPNERGLVPGAGSLIALVERATQQKATYIGKPEPIIMNKALQRIGLAKEDVIMVGDNYMTDISAGINCGLDTLLVYTGVSTKAQVAQKKVAPTYEIDSLADWKFKDE